MIAYLDASVLIPLIIVDPHSIRAKRLLAKHQPSLLASDFAAAEFASAVARRVRMRDLTREEGQRAFVTLDTWIARVATRIETTSADITVAGTYLRRLDLTLRAPDAINIAIAQRLGATLFTFDEKMADAANALKVEFEL